MIERPIRVLELRSVRGTGGGPEKTILLGAARSDHRRFVVTVCYLRDARDELFSVGDQAAALAVDYVEIVEKQSLDYSIWPRLRALIRDRAIDVVHAHDYKTDLLTWLLSRVENVVPLSTVHGWTGHSRRERSLYYPLDKRVLAVFPKLIAVSNDIRLELLRCGARSERIATVLNGIDHDRFRRARSREQAVRRRLGLAADDMVIGAVGRLERQKRFDLLIDAFAELRASHPRLKLLIAGEGSARDSLCTRIARLGCGAHCRLLGHQSDIVDLHHAFDLFVQSSDYEGTPNAVLEAMALETPIVATDVGGTSEIVRNEIDGLVVPTGKPRVLREAINRVLNDLERAVARAATARRRVETDLSFESRMTAVEAIYSELCARRHGAATEAVLPART